jgi:hypothetical protein
MAEIQTENLAVRDRNADHYTPFSVIFVSQEKPVGEQRRKKCTGEKVRTSRLGGRTSK